MVLKRLEMEGGPDTDCSASVAVRCTVMVALGLLSQLTSAHLSVPSFATARRSSVLSSSFHAPDRFLNGGTDEPSHRSAVAVSPEAPLAPDAETLPYPESSGLLPKE